MRLRTRHPAALLTAAVAATGLVVGLAGLPAVAVSDRARVPQLAFRGESTLAAGLTFAGTTVGGLSSLTYDADRGVYYAISDDQVSPRFYTLRIDVSDGRLDPGDVTVTAVTRLTDAAGVPLADRSLDPEGLALTRRGTLIVTSEGFAKPNAPVAPFVREFGLDGRQLRSFALPAYTTPDAAGTTGVRNNLGIESAALTRNGRFLFTGFENALVQDGDAATTATGSPARLQRFDARTGKLSREYVYVTDRVAEAPNPAGAFTVNGLVELLPMNSQFLLSMERSFSVGAGNTVKLYRAALPGATDVKGVDDLERAERLRPVRKGLVLDLDALGLTLDNLEGMTLGPRLPDGGRALVLASDNNFTPGQVSQFLLFSTHGLR